MIAHHKRQHGSQMLDLRQNGFHTRRFLDQDHQRDRFERHIHLDILRFLVVEQVEFVGLQAVDDVAAPVGHQNRRYDVGQCSNRI